MDTLQILERLHQLRKTVEVTIYGGKGWYGDWIIKLEYSDEDNTKVETEGRNADFAVALNRAWNNLYRAAEVGAAPHALLPPVEHAQIEAPTHEPPVPDDEIPF